MARFRDLSDIEVTRFIQLMLSHYDLPVQNNHDLVVRRDYNKLVSLSLYDLNLVNVVSTKFLFIDSLEEREHAEVPG